jgi:hypothetical protein
MRSSSSSRDRTSVYQSAIYPTIDANDDGKTNLDDYRGDWDHDGKDIDPRDAAHAKFSRATDVWGPAAHEFMTRTFAAPISTFTKNCLGTSYMQ